MQKAVEVSMKLNFVFLGYINASDSSNSSKIFGFHLNPIIIFVFTAAFTFAKKIKEIKNPWIQTLILAVLFLPIGASAFQPRLVTSFPVLGYREIEFFDDYHRIDRTLLIWYPVNEHLEGKMSKNPWDNFKVILNATPSLSKMPIVLISHDYAGDPHQLSWLIQGLAHQGFLVLGIQHRDTVEGKAHLNHWQRALDLSKMIDQFSKSPLSGWGNLNKIAVVGYSLGGTTAIIVAGGRTTKLKNFKQESKDFSAEEIAKINEALPTLNKTQMSKDWRDKRIKAAFVMAPSWPGLFDEMTLRKITIPIYILSVDADQGVKSKNNAEHLTKNIPQSIHQQIPGKAGPYVFISNLNAMQKDQADPTHQLSILFEDEASINRAWIQLQVIAEVCRFFKTQFE
ncbi:MAG: hypothetical protein BGO14_04650 [Chlamydiales bacterium 38-26]|nr:MAG: hypothetical protein BGO14_04650 [Chlamydiales bacterium 38-26]